MINHLPNGDFRAVFGVLNTDTTAAQVGYDNTFMEPHVEAQSAEDRVGVVGRREDDVIVRVQMDFRIQNRLQQYLTGAQPERSLELVADWRELEEDDLIDAAGECKIQNGARLKQILDRDGNVLHDFPLEKGGLSVDQVDAGHHVMGLARQVVWTLTPKARGVS